MKKLRPEELSAYDGKTEKPTYVVYKEKVYDVTESKLWKGGMHMRRHPAGKDLTTDLQAAPHGAEVLERYPQVGVIEAAESEVEADAVQPPLPPHIAILLEKNPFFRRHPHPMTVHFPIVFMLSAPLFTFLYLLTGHSAFDTTAFHCLGAGILFSAVAIVTGVVTWRYNYLGKMMLPVAIKMPLSAVMMAMAAAAFLWRLLDPGVLVAAGDGRGVYLFVVFALVPLVSVIGWNGATMTFPLEQE
ncbi:MAG: cytochrome b5 domain-containing protein [Desulfosarcinaceae bacterium]|nr:cytochrome b5 domain-containing protein [Desulfosarcinaceae bacterium]